jgi:uncharacterized protein (UPF0297 family)
MVLLSDETRQFVSLAKTMDVRDALQLSYGAHVDKRYNPILQIVGYVMSGDPGYITAPLIPVTLSAESNAMS